MPTKKGTGKVRDVNSTSRIRDLRTGYHHENRCRGGVAAKMMLELVTDGRRRVVSYCCKGEMVRRF